jgi:hypothetical protein
LRADDTRLEPSLSEPLQRPRARTAIGPKVISSLEEAMGARLSRHASAPAHFVDADAAQRLLHAMQTVKAARFTAAERFERKHTLAMFAMSMVSLYFVGLSVWQAIYAPLLDEPTNRLVTLVSIMSSIFTLVLALIEAMNDYKMKAHHMHECALAVNDLYHELKALPAPDGQRVQEFRHQYNAVVRGCPLNHTRLDYLMARAERKIPWEEKAWARLRYAFDVYGLYGLCLITPPLVLLLFR